MSESRNNNELTRARSNSNSQSQTISRDRGSQGRRDTSNDSKLLPISLPLCLLIISHSFLHVSFCLFSCWHLKMFMIFLFIFIVHNFTDIFEFRRKNIRSKPRRARRWLRRALRRSDSKQLFFKQWQKRSIWPTTTSQRGGMEEHSESSKANLQTADWLCSCSEIRKTKRSTKRPTRLLRGTTT